MNSKEITEKLCEEHIKLVGFIIAKEFRCFTEKYPYLREDLYQEGCIGLYQAAKKHDENKGKFSTIACICIRNNMIKFCDRYVKKHYNDKIASLNECRFGKDESMSLEDVLGVVETEGIDFLLEKEKITNIQQRIKNCQIKDIEEIVKLRLKGLNQTQIADIIGNTQVGVSRRLQKLRKELVEVC